MKTLLNLLIIIAPPSLEEPLVDWLLSNETEHGFSSYEVNGHTSQHDGLSLAEQVSGRKRRIQFQMEIPATDAELLIDKLKQDFNRSGIHYWVIPVIDAGHV